MGDRVILSRRLFVAGCASLPALAALKAAPLFAQPAAGQACVSELWGLPFWANGAEPAVKARRRKPATPTAWHPEFS